MNTITFSNKVHEPFMILDHDSLTGMQWELQGAVVNREVHGRVH